MTKSRKIGISVALMLIFVLACTVFVPMYANNNANVAHAVTVQTRDEWVNTYTGSYYDNLNTNKTGSSFYDDLASLITHTKNPSYDDLKDIFKTTDADPNKSGNVIWFYTGDSIPYTGAMDSGNYRTNREHVWPKMGGDAFPEKSQAGSDAHHLRPLNTQLNNTRSNYHFGEVTQSSGSRVYQDGVMKNYGTDDPDTWCYLSGGYFYPAKGYRGATARILFYVQTRWGKTSSLSFTLGKGSTKVMSNVDILMKWHLQEPPTDEEIRRNEAVYKIQGNRNPFIDHPEYAEMIYCYDGQSYNNKLKEVVATYGGYLDNSNPNPTPTLTGLTLNPNTVALTVGETSAKITVTASPAGASNVVSWTTSNSSVATVNNNNQIVAAGVGNATITATSMVNNNIKATVNVTVTASQVELEDLTISPSPLELAMGGSRQLTVTASPKGADNRVTWSSSNASVATVSADGTVTAKSIGTATITATSVDNPSISASVTVTVISQEENAQQFQDSVNAIANAKTLQERYNAIKRAIDCFNQMGEAEKTVNAAYVDTLQQAMDAYNAEVRQLNGELEQATNLASQIMANGISLTFMGLVVIVIKRVLGR